ncbi:MAG: signal recognition particle-docking protein FtsY [Clostridiales bacterium]|nr:signal recognition particle-docking protein FtsY [Clostridiales bacterium]MDD7036146.1 signal recognition particle-docking protein FtsY [Bacillota bacterium]MDY2921194.1 signal recognition particle-docking protein FtsY [Lentihominibacter sp.]
MLGEKKGFFGRLSQRISDALMMRPTIDEDFFDDLEEILITSDIGMDTTMKIVETLRSEVQSNNMTKHSVIKIRLGKIIADFINKGEAQKLSEDYPLVILMIGINGGGKTTSIGKLAYKFKQQGKNVMLAAADTFRAAAGEQLSIWADRVGVPVIRHGEGADPSAVIYDAIQSAKARNADVLICDTAGRLQNKKNLMNELNKMSKVIDREWPEATRENLLVLDATTGKNAVSQVSEFGEAAGITGIVLTKLDGTAKGGIVLTIADEFDMPVKFVGLGEGIEDLVEFDPVEFARGIFEEE